MLSQRFTLEQLKEVLVPRSDWRPFPTVDDREPWDGLRDSIRQAHLSRGEKRLDFDYPPVPATRFLDYARDGNRSRYEGLTFGRRKALVDLILAECIEADGRFLDDIANGIWAICEESFWGVPAHIGAQRAGVGLPDVTEPIVDLFAAETSALLAWATYLLGDSLDAVSPLIRPRIALEVERRILEPLFTREDFGWMGFQGQSVNNWNPWIVSNWLTSALIVEPDEARRAAHVEKALRTVDHFIDPYPKDGGCDEGPSYWGRAGAALYDCLRILHSASGGAVDVYDEPLVQEIARFIYRVHIGGQYFVNFADAPATLVPSPGVVFAYGKAIGDEQMMRLGAWAADRRELATKGAGESIGRCLEELFLAEEILATDPVPPLPRDVWLDEIEVMVARDADGSSEGLFIAAKGGHNAESHNHNDVGNFVVYTDGKPLLIDAGVESYTANTFSSRRYEIWTMQSAFHSLPTINGVQQAPGGQFAASDASYEADDIHATMSLDIAGAYPPEAGVKSWVRSVSLGRGADVVITDAYDLESVTGEVSLNLLTPCDVTLGDPGVIFLTSAELGQGRTSGAGKLEYDAESLTASLWEVPVTAGRLTPIWGESLVRIILRADDPAPRATWTLRVTMGS